MTDDPQPEPNLDPELWLQTLLVQLADVQTREALLEYLLRKTRSN